MINENLWSPFTLQLHPNNASSGHATSLSWRTAVGGETFNGGCHVTDRLGFWQEQLFDGAKFFRRDDAIIR